MDFILNCFRKPTKLDAATLECQDASTSGAIIDALRGDARVGADISAILARDPAAISYLQCIMFFKGFHATQAPPCRHSGYRS